MARIDVFVYSEDTGHWHLLKSSSQSGNGYNNAKSSGLVIVVGEIQKLPPIEVYYANNDDNNESMYWRMHSINKIFSQALVNVDEWELKNNTINELSWNKSKDGYLDIHQYKGGEQDDEYVSLMQLLDGIGFGKDGKYGIYLLSRTIKYHYKIEKASLSENKIHIEKDGFTGLDYIGYGDTIYISYKGSEIRYTITDQYISSIYNEFILSSDLPHDFKEGIAHIKGKIKAFRPRNTSGIILTERPHAGIWAHEINHIVLNGGGHLYDMEQDSLNLMYFQEQDRYNLRYRELNFEGGQNSGRYSQWKRINSSLKGQKGTRSWIY
jgi:hypothetical protein